METKKAFATRLVEERQKANLTQAELAEKLDISRQAITQYERQIRIPDIEMIRKFAVFFGVTTDYLIGLSDCKTSETDAIHKNAPNLSSKVIEILQVHARNRDIIDRMEKGQCSKEEEKHVQFLLEQRVYGNTFAEMQNTLHCYNIVLTEISMHPELVKQLAQYWYSNEKLGITSNSDDSLPPEYIRLSDKLHIMYIIDQIEKEIIQKNNK